ncbi:phosphate/phosphite/phosphonate ABC transporter substrate-binding protein [Geotalea sp. SG265]|uniref:phosphate/phosphite/phosphonate ABC transporter substrate-binding protein n=1 Tax=Geotalea sp. SG265 TaxID=2922867 RepID=UPI001FB02672|nr:phosphate/phosphite/phosphonate ABC transporter substrate-binding protein [Geotalea sp. SG265]
MKNILRIAAVFLVFLFLLPSAVSSTHSEKPVIRFGVNLQYNPISMYKRYQPLMDYLTQNTPYRFELKISRDYLECLRYLKYNTTQISFLGDIAFVEARLRFGAIPILKPLGEDGRPAYRSAIVVSSSSSLHSLQDLKGKKVAFGNLHSTSGNLFPRYMLLNKRVYLQELGGFTNFSNHDEVAKAVLRGDYDAGAVNDTTADKYSASGLRVLAYSDPIPTSPIVVRSDAPKALTKAVTDALLKLDRNNPTHEKLMASWDDSLKNGFTTASLSDYRLISRMFKTIPYSCGKGCHR